MKINLQSHRLALFLLAMFVVLACSLSVSSATPAPETAVSETLPTTATQTLQPEPTETIQPGQPTSTAEGPEEATATSLTTSCTVLQDLNLRSGPGTAYRPPVRVLPANSVIIPLGFAPQGIPGGSWAYVQDAASQDKGWVSAGAQYISCNVELASLPAVAFGTPPPPPLPKSAQTSDPDGNGFCIDPDSGYQCVGIFSEEALFEFKIIRNGNEQGPNDGVEEVQFNVRRDGEQVYSTNEVNQTYCVFGGNGPCNPWVVENGVYKWRQGGPPAEPGEYEMEVNATINGDDSRWAVTFTLTLP
jgi:hypothetical protein